MAGRYKRTHAMASTTNIAIVAPASRITPELAEQVRAIKAALRSAKTSADTAVQRAEFHTAFEIMQSLTQKYKIATKQFEEFTKKLKDIDAIATPSQK